MIRLSKLKIYDKGLGKVKIKNRYSASDDVLAVAISKDGRAFAGATFDKVYYFSEGRFQWRLNIDNFNSLSLSECGRYLVTATLTRLIYMDAPHFKPEEAYVEKTKGLPEEKKEGNYWIQPVTDIDIAVISSDGKNVVVGGEKALYYYTSTREKLWSFEMGDKIWGVCISKDGEIITAGSGKEVYYFNRDGRLLWQFRTGSLVRFPYLSSDGKKVLVSSSRKLYMFTKRGQLVSEVETGTSQTLGASEEMDTIAGGTSTEVFCFNGEGKRLWEKGEKDFINVIRVTANGEGVVVGTGSDVLNNPALQVYHRDGTLLWSYFSKGIVKAIATDENGHYIVVGVGRKIKRFENTIILTRTSITVSERCREVLEALKARGIEVSRQEKDFQEYNLALKHGRSEEALTNLLDLDKALCRIKERYQMAKDTIPNWLESLGLSVEANNELINGIFPLYNKYIDINDNRTLANKKSQMDSYVKGLKKALESVDPNIIKDIEKKGKRPVLKQKLSTISTTIEAISGLKKVVENLQTEKINFIFELEDTTRNIILDHLSGKNYEKVISESLQRAEKFEAKIEALLHRIQRFESTIKMWREQESMYSPDSVLVEIKTSTKEEEGSINLIITITDHYKVPITKVNVRAFTKDPIFNFIEPEHGVSGILPEIPSERSEEFWFKLLSGASEDVVVNGILTFELERVEYRVRLPPMNISLLSPNITGASLSEGEYSKTMENNENYQEALAIKGVELKEVMNYLQERLRRFNVVRDKKAVTGEGEARILWNAGKFGKKDLILVTVVVREREGQEIEIGTSAYSTDFDKAKAFVQDMMNYFSMTYKVKDIGA